MKKNRLTRLIILGTALVLALSIVLAYFNLGSIKYEIKENTLYLNSYYMSKNPIFDSQINLDYYTASTVIEYDLGQNISAVEYPKIKSGKFKNDDGEYTLYKYSKIDTLILLREKDTKAVKFAFNLKSEEETIKAYQRLKELLS